MFFLRINLKNTNKVHDNVYNVTIFNRTSVVYNHQFSDIDDILDLEIVPISKTTSPTQIMQGNNLNNMFPFNTIDRNNNFIKNTGPTTSAARFNTATTNNNSNTVTTSNAQNTALLQNSKSNSGIGKQR